MATDPFANRDRDEDADELAFLMQLFSQRRSRRVNFEQQWEESAALAWPEYMSSFFYGRDVAPGMKRTQFQVDSSVSVASHRFGAIVDWLISPSNMLWSKVQASDEDLMKVPAVKEWFSQVTRILWSERYKAEANFIPQQQQNCQGLGVFGNMAMFIDELDDYLEPKARGLRYLGLPVGEIYVETDHQRRVVGFIRHFRLTAQQHKMKFPEKSVPVIEAALQISSQQLFDVLHFVRPRTDYNPAFMLAPQGKKYVSTYMSVQGYCILKRGGYRMNPLAYGRYMLAPDEDYGRGPMQMVLAAAKSKNAAKRDFLTQAHRAGDPAFLVPDTGLVDLQTRSGAWNAGGVNSDGVPLVHIMPTGNIQVTKEMLDEEGETINDAFLVSLFKLILDTPKGEQGSRQIIEYINERGILLAGTVGGQNPQYLGPLIDREIDILAWQRRFPPMPPALREAKGDYKIQYTSPIARAMQSAESAGYQRTLEFAEDAVKATGDPSIMDVFDFEVAIPEMGEQNNAPDNWFSSAKKIASKRQARAAQQKAEDDVKSLPGRAAMAKAQAITAKAQTGGNTGGTLSGTAAGGMPMMPNQQSPGGSTFGGTVQGP